MKVVFNDRKDFEDEIATQSTSIESNLIRVTGLFTCDAGVPALRRVSVCATFICGGLVYEYTEHLCAFLHPMECDKANNAITKAIAEVTRICETYGKEVRRGRITLT